MVTPGTAAAALAAALLSWPEPLAVTMRSALMAWSALAVADLDSDAPKVATGLFCYVGDDWRDHLIQARPYAALYAIRHRDIFALLPPGSRHPRARPMTDALKHIATGRPAA